MYYLCCIKKYKAIPFKIYLFSVIRKLSEKNENDKVLYIYYAVFQIAPKTIQRLLAFPIPNFTHTKKEKYKKKVCSLTTLKSRFEKIVLFFSEFTIILLLKDKFEVKYIKQDDH